MVEAVELVVKFVGLMREEWVEIDRLGYTGVLMTSLTGAFSTAASGFGVDFSLLVSSGVFDRGEKFGDSMLWIGFDALSFAGRYLPFGSLGAYTLPANGWFSFGAVRLLFAGVLSLCSLLGLSLTVG